MQPTVLAGAIEFTPADVAAVLAVLAALFLLVTAPGWLLLAYAAGRRPGASATSARRWATRVGGGLTGIALCSGSAAAISALVDEAFVVGIVVGWAACWLLAARLRPRAAAATTTAQGWGR